jgi:hypothetical protein
VAALIGAAVGALTGPDGQPIDEVVAFLDDSPVCSAVAAALNRACDRADAYPAGAGLPGAGLRGAGLTGAELTGAGMAGARFDVRPAGSGCLSPVLEIVATLAGGPRRRLIVTASPGGDIALALATAKET